MNQLKAAIQSNNFEQFVRLIKTRRVDPYCADHNGNSFMHLSAMHGCFEITQFLLTNGMPVDLSNNINMTPLHSALMFQHSQIAKMLIDHGANVNSQSSKGITPIFYPTLRNDKDMAYYLLKNGAATLATAHNGLTLFELSYSNLIEEIVQSLHIHVETKPFQATIEYTRKDFSSTGVVLFRPSLLAFPHPEKKYSFDKHYIAELKGAVVQIRLMALPGLETDYKESILNHVAEKKAFFNYKLSPLIGTILLDDDHYGIISWQVNHPNLYALINPEYDAIKNVERWAIIVQIFEGISYYLKIIPKAHENFTLTPSTVYYDLNSKQPKIEVDGPMIFDRNNAAVPEAEFIAPEVLSLPRSVYFHINSTHSFSLGAIAYLLIAKRERFANKNAFDIGIEKVKFYKLKNDMYPDIFNNQVINKFFKLLVCVNPETRPTLLQLSYTKAFQLSLDAAEIDEDFLATVPGAVDKNAWRSSIISENSTYVNASASAMQMSQDRWSAQPRRTSVGSKVETGAAIGATTAAAVAGAAVVGAAVVANDNDAKAETESHRSSDSKNESDSSDESNSKNDDEEKSDAGSKQSNDESSDSSGSDDENSNSSSHNADNNSSSDSQGEN